MYTKCCVTYAVSLLQVYDMLLLLLTINFISLCRYTFCGLCPEYVSVLWNENKQVLYKPQQALCTSIQPASKYFTSHTPPTAPQSPGWTTACSQTRRHHHLCATTSATACRPAESGDSSSACCIGHGPPARLGVFSMLRLKFCVVVAFPVCSEVSAKGRHCHPIFQEASRVG